MNVKAIIEAAGGREATSRLTGLDPNSVLYWQRRGSIPGRHLPVLLREAENNGADISALLSEVSAA